MPNDKYDYPEVLTDKRHKILSLASAKLHSQEPFCLARFPGEENLNIYLNPSVNRQNKNESFLVKGWNKDDITYYFASANGEEHIEDQPVKLDGGDKILVNTTFKTYADNFNTYQNAFANTEVKKAILSRLKIVDIPAEYDLLTYFERLESAHPNALVTLILHPTEGLWIGASPEILISGNGNKYTTVSLAGTQIFSNSAYLWGKKEKEEQEYVSAHIRATLNKNDIRDFSEAGPSTTEAGSVAHLKTIFEFEPTDKAFDFLNFAEQLHPTPAISGTPVYEAIKLIAATENHSRRLYSGYLGRISAQSVDLYVNLRCMQVQLGKMILFLGGGITQNSQLEAEWEETEQKAKTLLKQING